MSTPSGVRARLALGLALQFAIGGAFLPFMFLHFLDSGLSYPEIGRIYVGIAITNTTMPIVWGMVADRLVPVNRLIVALHVLGGLSMLLLTVVDSFPGILLATVLWFGFSGSTNALFNALCYHNLSSPRAEFGRLRLWGSVGWMLPSVPIWWWLSRSGSGDLFSALYLAAALEGLFVFLALVLPHTPPRAQVGKGHGAGLVAAHGVGTFRRSLSRLLFRPGYLVLLLIVFLMFWSLSIVFSYSPDHLERSGVARAWIGPIQCLAPLVEVPLFLGLPAVLRRLGFHGTIAVGALAIVARQLVFATSDEPLLLTGTYALVGVGVVYYLITVSLLVDDMAEPGVRATAQTLVLFAGQGLGTMIGQLCSGWLADRYAPELGPVFAVGGAVAAVAILLLPVVAALERRERAPHGEGAAGETRSPVGPQESVGPPGRGDALRD